MVIAGIAWEIFVSDTSQPNQLSIMAILAKLQPARDKQILFKIPSRFYF